MPHAEHATATAVGTRDDSCTSSHRRINGGQAPTWLYVTCVAPRLTCQVGCEPGSSADGSTSRKMPPRTPPSTHRHYGAHPSRAHGNWHKFASRPPACRYAIPHAGMRRGCVSPQYRPAVADPAGQIRAPSASRHSTVRGVRHPPGGSPAMLAAVRPAGRDAMANGQWAGVWVSTH
jgi:hypothetical protein